MIKPNEKEFAELIGIGKSTGEDLIIEAKKLIQRGLKKVLISRGEKGCLLIKESGVSESKGLKVEMMSTVGAGDSMVAALVYSELNALDDRKTLMMPESAGIAAVMKEGSQTCTMKEVMKVSERLEKHLTSFAER